MTTANYVSTKDLIKRLGLEMPVSVSARDPLNGNKKVSFKKDNIHAMLAVNVGQLMVEAQWIPNLHAEMARMHRVCSVEAGRADTAYRKWKAEKAQELRAKKTKVTKEEIENYYRSQPEYEKMANKPVELSAISELFGDLKESFRQKAEMIKVHSRAVGGFESVAQSSDASLERLEEIASKAVEESGSAAAASKYAKGSAVEEEEDEDEEEDGEEDEEDEEEDDGEEDEDEDSDDSDEDDDEEESEDEDDEEDDDDESDDDEDGEEESDEDEDEDDEEDEDDDDLPPPPPPKPVTKKSKKAPAKKTTKKKAPAKKGGRKGKK